MLRAQTPLPRSWFTLGLLVALAACESAQERAANEAHGRAGLAEYGKTMAAIHTALSSRRPQDVHPVACDGATLKKAAGKDNLSLILVYGPFLARFTTPDRAWPDEEGPWAFLTDSTWRGHFLKNPKDREGYIVADSAGTMESYFLPTRYLVVLWPDDETQNRRPRLTQEGFAGGVFHGWMVLADQRTGELACQAHLDVANSQTVKFKNGSRGLGRLTDEKPEQAIERDFGDNFKKAIRQHLPEGIDITTSMGSFFG